ncbi:hypothetical protein [Kitasatospora sp. NPDC088783]|uniref:hypothetical protein n=1 Tax=Kitasatospora sp. NPDC088783 TaxID=3364077 RepID=UPI0038264345
MPDAHAPDPLGPAAGPDSPPLAADAALLALDAIRAVIAWYQAGIETERASAQPDPELLQEWAADQQTAAADRDRLRTATDTQAAAIAERCTRLLRTLTAG